MAEKDPKDEEIKKEIKKEGDRVVAKPALGAIRNKIAANTEKPKGKRGGKS
jgi:hypothetical protein